MKALDLQGREFGKLKAHSPIKIGNKRGWRCLCTCGGEVDVPTFQLTSGNYTRCPECRIGEDLTGVVVGKLTVVKRLPKTRPKDRWKWECLCECGNTKAVTSKDIQRGSATHCGCSPASRVRLPPEELAYRKRLDTYKRNAVSKGHSFELTADQFRELVFAPCHYCGAPPSPIHGVDRKDNTRGYTLDNSLSCCTWCNLLKKDSLYSDFLAHVNAIAKRHQSHDPDRT